MCSSKLLARTMSTSRGVPKGDDLEGEKSALKTGYGQSNWFSEKLLFEAGKRGFRGHIVRRVTSYVVVVV